MCDILLYDKFTSGHHLSYLRIYASAFSELGLSVKILTSDVTGVELSLSDHPKFRSETIDVKNIQVRNVTKIEKIFSSRVGIIRDIVNSFAAFLDFLEINRNIKKNGLDKNSVVFLMWFEPFVSKYLPATILNLFFSYNLAGLWFHPSDIKFINDDKLRHRDLLHHVPILNYRKLKFLGLFDRLIVCKLQELYDRDVFRFLPDIAEEHKPDLSSELITEILNQAGGRKIVSLLGSLDKRKNILSFFEVVSHCNCDDIFYVCAGQLHKNSFSSEELDFIYSVTESMRGKFYFHDQHIDSDVVFDSLFFISDLIVAVYRNFTSSSNMITKAAIYKKYIIVADEYLMCETVEKYGIGRCIVSDDPVALCEAILDVIKNHEKLDGRFLALVEEQSHEKLKEYLKPLVGFCFNSK